ncbi:hypothetical protein B0H14DRAFT_3104210 [Mycena olivaceomarginata]|nr:hypothetical protein B0H14DRAFT_3104210 [Mycena olivaceomarginata]
MPTCSTFKYQQASSMGSILWSLWLRLPSRWRGMAYRIFVHHFGHRQRLSPVHRLPCVYAKPCRSMDEPLATEYVRTHTSIPVPKILDVVPTGDERRPWLMISTHLPGTPLFISGTGHRLIGASDRQLQRVTDVLSDWITQLRALPSPHGERVCGFAGGPLRSFRIGEDPVGPFDTVADFHSQPFCTVVPYDYDAASPDIQQLISARPHKDYAIHLVHGDLVLHNILADENLCPTGIIDWECAAWMPEYWENVSSSYGAYWSMWCWKDIRRDAFPQYEDDLIIDRQIQKSWCD